MTAAGELAAAFALGVGLGLLYDVYRVWFRQAGKRRIRALGDIVWWLLAFVLAAVALYRINSLELRGFTLALAVAGAVAEQAWASPRFFPLSERVCAAIRHCLRRIWRLICRATELLLSPVVWAVAFILRLCGALFAAVKKVCRGIWRRFGKKKLPQGEETAPN